MQKQAHAEIASVVWPKRPLKSMAIVLVLKLVFESGLWNAMDSTFPEATSNSKDSEITKIQKIAKYAAAKHSTLIVPNEMLLKKCFVLVWFF